MKSRKRPDALSSTKTDRAARDVVNVVIMVIPANTHELTNHRMSSADAEGRASVRFST